MPTVRRQIDTSSVETEVLEIIRGLLQELRSAIAADYVTPHSSFERELGLGSLERVELLVRCESRFQRRLPDDVAQHADTPEDYIRALIEEEEEAAPPRYRIEPPSNEAPPPPDHAMSMAEVLRRCAEIEPDRVQAHLLEGEGGEDITYRHLLETASAVAAGLKALGLRRDDTAAIMLPTCADFFYAFFGVMLAGGIAVPIYPPARPDKIEEYFRRQVAILRNAGVRFLISFSRTKAITQIIRLTLPSITAVTTVEELRQAGSGARAEPAEVSSTAFIQYTSGSTGDPKGVVLSHANLLANIRGIGWAVSVRPTDVVVSWLPLYHDMGLIGSWLFSVYYGLPITVFSPLAFLSRPDRWLWALHDSRGTLCPAPNFSYDLCARKIPDAALEGLDLSAWRVAINAGEAVWPETLVRFAKRFEPYGFRVESFVPCYGLAESSVALAFPPINRAPRVDRIRREIFEVEGRAVPAERRDASALSFVACGKAMPHHAIRLVDEQGREVSERARGQLQFRGPSMTSEYYRNPEATAAVMTPDGWMNSGDLAYRAEGEIFVVGRVKDLIIKAGHNIAPQEIEAAAAEAPGVRRGCVAAFGSRDPESGTEKLVVVAETRATSTDELKKIEADIVALVSERAGIPPDRVELVPPQSIPKTSSGKIRRNETRLLFERHAIRATHRAPWLQIARLWLGNWGAWTAITFRKSLAGFYGAYTATFLAALGYTGGLLARLAAGRAARARTVWAFSRALLFLSGHHVNVEGRQRLEGRNPAVIFTHRASVFDPLVLAAALPKPSLIADASTLASLPRAARFLLAPLAVPPLKSAEAPAGGLLRDRIVAVLNKGFSVLVFPDSAIGAEPPLCRFRLDGFHAANRTASAVHAVGVRGSFRAIANRDPWATKITVSETLSPHGSDVRELAAWRERVKQELAELCR